MGTDYRKKRSLKTWFVIAIPVVIALFFVQDYFAPAGKSAFFHRAKMVSQSNEGVIPDLPHTDYKNSFAVHWIPIDWTKVVSAPRMAGQFPPLDQNTDVYSAQDITYCTAGDTNLKLDLYSKRPTYPGENKPMVVYIFGGGMLDGDKRMMYGTADHLLLTLVNDGFIVAAPNYRLAPQFKFPAMIRDVLCSVRFLRYYAYGIGGDQNRIGLHGESVGGQLSELVGVTSGTEPFENAADEHIAGANVTFQQYLAIPTKPQAAVSYYGGGELPDNPVLLFIVEHMIGLLPNAPTAWHDPIPGSGNKTYSQADIFKDVYNSDSTLTHEASAYNYITANEPPFLIIQGDKDRLTPPNQALDMYTIWSTFSTQAPGLLQQEPDFRKS